MESNPVSKVRVVVRVRPFLPHELASKIGNATSCVSVLTECESAGEVAVHLKDPDTSRNECFRLDSCFGQEDNNAKHIFDLEVNPLLPGIFHGCNATVFAYGATGSGKTYTMQGTDEHPGLMPLAISAVLSMCHKTGSNAEISYYEVYMDRCYDLLEVKAKEITVLDDKDGQIHLRGLSRVPVNSMSEFFEVFDCAIQRRKVAHTGLNDVSSRSHGVLVIVVSTPCGDETTVTGKLSLIDLAGNEDNRRTCNEGIRLQESAKINQSLFALSNVIYALNNNKSRVPYRESKLTRILQDSLGGTSRSLMVACLNPGEYQESVHTVSLAARSRHITNFVYSAQKQDTPKVKIDMEAKLRDWLESKGKTKSGKRMGAFGSPFFSKTPTSSKKVNSQLCSYKGVSNGKKTSILFASRNLFKNEDTVDACMESPGMSSQEDGEREIKAAPDRIMLELKTHIPDEPMVQEEDMTVIVSSHPINAQKIKAFQSPLRKALSPINSNLNRTQTISFLPDPNSPQQKIPSLVISTNENSQNNETPLDKFNALSSHLKSSLAQEYIDFLNTASREELLELKGIGQKRADYILELRERSPLKSLDDLEKIGLSAKQVHNMFSRAARGIFA